MGWDDHDRHRRSRPSDEGIAAMGAALGLPGRALWMRRLGGGIASATHLVAYGQGHSVVIKRYPAGDETPALEWERLHFACAAGLPAPHPLGLDADGAWFGGPNLVLSRLPGRADLAPGDPGSYLSQVAHTLARIHETDITLASGALTRPHSVDQWTPPETIPAGLLDPKSAEALLSFVVTGMDRIDRTEKVFNHGDFHPGNLTWSRGCLSGVADWSAARVGYRWWELSYFVNEVGLLIGSHAADSLRGEYEAQIGQRCADPGLWDATCLWSAHCWGHLWLIGYREQGRTDLQIADVRRWIRSRTRRLLQEAGAR